MVQDLDANVITELDAQQKKPCLIVDISLGGLTLRYCSGHSDIVFPHGGATTYTAKSMKVGNISQSIEGQVGRVSLKLDNVTRDMSTYANSYVFEGRMIWIAQIFLDSDGNAPAVSTEYKERFYGKMERIKEISSTWLTVTGTTGKPLRRKALLDVYGRECRHRFGYGQCNQDGFADIENSDFISQDERIVVSSPWINDAGGAADETGFDGTPNAACTLEDASSGGYDYNYLDITIPATAISYVVSVYVKKTTAATTFPRVHIKADGGAGAAIFAGIILNTNTDAVTAISGWEPDSHGVDTTNANFDRVQFIFTNIDHANIRIYLSPAGSSNGTTEDPTAQGTAVFDYAQVKLGTATGTATGTADSGTTTTLVDSALTQVDDFWNYGDITITKSGTIYKRKVSDFDAAGDEITFDLALPVAVDATTTYTVFKGCDKTRDTCQANNAWGPSADNKLNFGGNIHVGKQVD